MSTTVMFPSPAMLRIHTSTMAEVAFMLLLLAFTNATHFFVYFVSFIGVLVLQSERCKENKEFLISAVQRRGGSVSSFKDQ